MKKACILLATFNGEKFIDEQIRSILSQTYRSFDVYIRDDGSNDDTVSIINYYAENYPNIKILKSNEQTGSAAANFYRLIQSVNLDNYDFFAFCDQDDIWMPDKLNRAILSIESNNASGYSSDLICFNKEIRKIWCLKKVAKQKKYDYLFQGASAGCTYVFKLDVARLVVSLINNSDFKILKSISHDWLIYAITRSNSLSWFHDEFPSILYRQHSNNVYGALPGLGGIKVKLSMIKNGWLLNQVILLEPFLKKDSFTKMFFIRIKRLSFFDRLFMIKDAGSFRRSARDVLLMRLIFLLRVI